MPAKALMIQGTASFVGKSIIVTALCRIFKQDGYKVAPFKAQNMSNNSYVTLEGGEIGRAQAVQAEAAGIAPSIYMNPILLKPESDNKSQIVVLGQVYKRADAKSYYSHTSTLSEIVKTSLNKLCSEHDIVVIEGAGSPAEINLKENEIVNMFVAKLLKAPVLLVGDIDRGGVFASILGTLQLLDRSERRLIKGIIINKFRGDIKLLEPALKMLENRLRKPVLGIIPYLNNINIAQEDSVYLENKKSSKYKNKINIGIIYVPHISNYDDFDPLESLGCNIKYIKKPPELNEIDLIILPGTKSTVADLNYLKNSGIADMILQQSKKGIPILGICGGFQMLCREILDPLQVESNSKQTPGLGLLNCSTVFSPKKKTTQIKGRLIVNKGIFNNLEGMEITGYEIHMGNTHNCQYQSLLQIVETPPNKNMYYDGAVNESGTIAGTYVHGLFHNYSFATGLVNNLRQRKNLARISIQISDREKAYDILAESLRQHLDIKQIYKIMLGKK